MSVLLSFLSDENSKSIIFLAPIERKEQKWLTACHKMHHVGERRCEKNITFTEGDEVINTLNKFSWGSSVYHFFLANTLKDGTEEMNEQNNKTIAHDLLLAFLNIISIPLC